MIGTTVSHYRIVEKLGRGGMGVVYRARDTVLDRDVALKFLAPELTDSKSARTRFLHEARIASKLRHKHICTIHEVGETPDGQLFICMDHYDGETLDARVARGSLPVDETVRIVAQVASGLSAAHAEGISHRDIKPANIMLPEDGDAVILDFGLAWILGMTRVTKSGATVGTVSYMSPEAVQGATVDARSDVWSLAVLAWEAMTGQLPFAAEHDVAVIYRIVSEAPGLLAADAPAIPDAVRQVIERALEKDPDARYQTAQEYTKDLADAAGVEVSSSLVSASPRKRSPRHSWMRFGVGAVIVVAITVAAFLVPQLGGGGAGASEMAVAVVDFGDASGETEFANSVTTLVNVGLVESSPIRVVSPALLHDLRRRLFPDEEGPIAHDQALELARRAGATIMVRGEVVGAEDKRQVAWQLVDTDDGRGIAAARSSGSIFECADRIVTEIVPRLGETAGVTTAAEPVSVTLLTTDSREAWESYVRAGEQFAALGDVITGTKKALELDPEFALAYMQLGAAYKGYRVINEDSARHYLDRAWELRARLDPKSRLLLEVGRHELAGRIGNMAEVYEEMLERWPDDRQTLSSYLGFLNFWVFPQDVTHRFAKRALALYPDDFWFLLSVENNTADPMEAVDGARGLVRVHPDVANAWDELGLRFLDAGEPDSAEVAFHKAVSIDSTFQYSRMGIAYCALARGDLEGALSLARELIERYGDLKYELDSINPYYGDYGSIGLMLYDAGGYKEALAVLDDFAGRVPDNDWMLYRLTWGQTRILISMRNYEEALRRIDREMERSDLSFRDILRWQRALVLARKGSLDAARSEIESNMTSGVTRYIGAAVENPDHQASEGTFLAILPTAEIAMASGNPEEAARNLERMKRWQSATHGWLRSEGQKLLARAYAANGDTDRAVQVLREFLRLRPTHALAHYELGRIYEIQGRTGDAAVEYSTFLEMWKDADPDLVEIHDARERLERVAPDHALNPGRRAQRRG